MYQYQVHYRPAVAEGFPKPAVRTFDVQMDTVADESAVLARFQRLYYERSHSLRSDAGLDTYDDLANGAKHPLSFDGEIIKVTGPESIAANSN